MSKEFILQPPKVQPFYKNFSTIFSFLALGKQEWWGYKKPNKFHLFHSKLTIVSAPICIVSQIIYVFQHYKTLPFGTLSIIISIFPVGLLTNTCVGSAQLKSFEKIMKMFMNKIHLYNYKDYNDATAEIAVKIENSSRLAIYFFTFSLMTDGCMWIIVPLRHVTQNIEGIKNKTVMLHTLLHLWMPFDYGYNITNWAIVHVMNSYICFMACVIIVTFNSLSYIFLFQLIGHVQILKHKFQTEFSVPQSDNATKAKLITLIKDHAFIIEVFNDMKDAFGYNVTANYCHNLLSDSFLLYLTVLGNTDDWMLYGMMVFGYLGGLVVMSLILEEIRRESSDIADVVYSIPWENMSIPNQKTLMVMLARAQPDIEFISAGGLRAGVRPTISIIKSTFSYYVMLKSSMRVNK